MKIVIAGGSGFIGYALEKHFQDLGHQVYILTRFPRRSNDLYWDAKTLGTWCDTLATSDLLINLTGKSVDCRYTKSNKKEIRQSRIESTKILNKAVENSTISLFLNASSATIYAYSTDHLNTESNGIIGNDFSMNVVKDWETQFFNAPMDSIRRVALRMSIVLGQQGGAFPKMKQVTAMGLGGRQGHGQQWISWIHIEDLCRTIDHIINDKTIHGPVNITSPHPIRNVKFTRLLSDRLRKRIRLPQARWMLEIGAFMLRTETELLLKSRYVYPGVLLKSGFEFNYPTLSEALSFLDE